MGKYVGMHGKAIGIDHFGESAPAGQVFQAFGFTVGNVLAAIDELPHEGSTGALRARYQSINHSITRVTEFLS